MLDIRGLDDMTASKRHSGFFKVVNLSEMVGCLEDLITYFAQPEEELSKLDHLYNRKVALIAVSLFQALASRNGVANKQWRV